MRRLPLFVLPTVLFPGTRMPLHIFEPRYRRLVGRSLEMDRRFGLIFHDFDRGPFLVEEGGIGCTAEIREYQPLPDGRSLILVEGVDRFRIVDGVDSGTPYYEALVSRLRDDAVDAVRLAGHRRRSIELFKEAAAHFADPSAPRIDLDPEEEVSFRIAEHLRIEVTWRQALLESVNELERLERVDAVLRSVLDRYQDEAP